MDVQAEVIKMSLESKLNSNVFFMVVIVNYICMMNNFTEKTMCIGT